MPQFGAPQRPEFDFSPPQPSAEDFYNYLLQMLQMMEPHMRKRQGPPDMPEVDLPPGEMEELQKRRFILTQMLRGQGQG